jgi:hypothetical protein
MEGYAAAAIAMGINQFINHNFVAFILERCFND